MSSWRVVGLTFVVGAALWLASLWQGMSPSGLRHTDRASPVLALSESEITSISIRTGTKQHENHMVATREDIAGDDGRTRWTMGGYPVSEAVLAQFFAVTETASARRVEPLPKSREDLAVLGLSSPLASLEIGLLDGRVVSLALGSLVAGELRWVQRDQAAVLMSATEAAALFRKPSEWYERRVLRELPDIDGIDSVELRVGDQVTTLTGSPLAIVRGFTSARIDRDKLAWALSQWRDLEFIATPINLNAEDPPSDLLRVMIHHANGPGDIDRMGQKVTTITEHGPCPIPFDGSGRLITVNGLNGCARSSVLESWREIGLSPETLMMLGVIDDIQKVTRVTLVRIHSSVRAKPVVIETKGDGSDAAAEWLRLLKVESDSVPVQIQSLLANGEPAVVGRVDLAFEHGRDRILVLQQGGLYWLRLDGQSQLWPLPRKRARALLDATLAQFRLRKLVRRDRTELRKISRGSLSWQFELGNGWQPAIDERMVTALTQLDALRFEPTLSLAKAGLDSPRAQIVVTFAPAPIATIDPNTLTIELGREVEDGCYGRVKELDTGVIVFERSVCQALDR